MATATNRYLAPNWFVRRLANQFVMRAGLATTLELRTRRRNQLQAIPVNVLRFDGREYLVSVRGESDWVRNLQVAGNCELRRWGRRRRYTVAEVAVEQRPAIIAAYRKRWGYQVGVFFRRLPSPADHPVFALRSAN